MDIYIPFTYIIGWSKHKKFYYGSKYAQGCQPSDLWESYFTSSKHVITFRETYGEPDIIKIHRIFKDKDSCVLFEHEYLTKINAKNHPLFLNESNGNKDFNGSGANWTEKSFIKASKTWNIKYGVDNPSKSEEIKQKKNETFLANWGVDNPSQSPIIREKIKQTNLEKHGVDNPSQSPIIRRKIIQTCMEKYGFDIPTKSPIIKEKTKQTNLEHWGYESHNQSPSVKQKKKEASLKKYGYEHVSQVPELKEKTKKTCIEKYGVDHTSKIMNTCRYCGEHKSRAHENQCSLKPNKKKRNMSRCANLYEVISPDGERYEIRGKEDLEIFAKQRGLKHWAFVNNLKCPGWIIKKL